MTEREPIRPINRHAQERKRKWEPMAAVDQEPPPDSTYHHRLKAFKEKVDPEKAYPLEEAVGLLKEFSTVKFNETVELAVNLGVDAKKSDQAVRGAPEEAYERAFHETRVVPILPGLMAATGQS